MGFQIQGKVFSKQKQRLAKQRPTKNQRREQTLVLSNIKRAWN